MNPALGPADFEALRRAYLFSGLERDEFREAIGHAAPVRLAPGQLLFSQGDPVNAIYWVAEGVIKLFRASPQGDEKVIELVGANRLFAEAVMFMGGQYPINAVAQTAARLVAIDGREFKAWLARDVGRCFRLLSGVSARMHKLIDEIDRLTLMKGGDRLLQYLLDHSDPDASGRQKVELEAPKQIIASRIGVKPETLSRLLHKLADQGYVEIQGQTIYMRDSENLRDARIE
jgi:CRP-like cAMP-binding protein